MKRIFLALVFLAAAACTSLPANQPTPAQVASAVCPSFEAAITVLSVPGAVDPSVSADLAIAAPVVAKVCHLQDGKILTSLDLQGLLEDATPTLLKVVEASTLEADKKQQIVLGVTLAKALLAPAIANAASVSTAEPASK